VGLFGKQADRPGEEPSRHTRGAGTARGRALPIQRADNDRWELPGGVLELGETIHDGLRREVREETGLGIEPIAVTGVYKNMTRAIIALVFRCKIAGGALATNDEAAGCGDVDGHTREAALLGGANEPVEALSGRPVTLDEYGEPC
jgi:8-oxo-dGTP pyrophosphatase MutT (NUDIX family)